MAVCNTRILTIYLKFIKYLFLLPQTLWSSFCVCFNAYPIADKHSLSCSQVFAFCFWLTCRLTAFVYKSFAQAKRYIYIDNNVQSQTLIWLASKQKSDGCFENVGSHFNNALKVTEFSIFWNFQSCHWYWFILFLPDPDLLSHLYSS